jgi:predicted nucleic acid-binding Zn ribbon protein
MERPESIRSILDKALKDLDIDTPLKAYSIFPAWRKIVGENIAAQTQPCFIRNRILFIDVSHSTWIQQLQFLKPKLLENIKEFLGENLIEDVRFRLGKVNPQPSFRKASHIREEKRLDRETSQLIEDLLKSIDDEEVKKLLRNIFIKSIRLKSKTEKLQNE